MELSSAQRVLLARMALLSYGTVTRFGGRGGGDSERIGPPGEAQPMADRWATTFAGATPENASALTEQAQAELDTYVRRPLAPDTTETWEELAGRIVADGWGVTAAACAMAMRCTPSMVRRARLAELRHPDTGYSLPVEADAVAWAMALDVAGLTLRQIEAVTGVSKSSVHRAVVARRRTPGAGGCLAGVRHRTDRTV